MKAGLFLLLLLAFMPLAASEKPPSAAIASAHPLATQAGFEVLNAGGNAFDAAVAITAALAVVEPYGSGLGGGGFWLLHRASDGFETMLDGRERAPLAAHRDMYLDEKSQVIRELSLNGPLAAAIPGVPAALAHLADNYGQLPLNQSLSAAIQYAEEGVTVGNSYRRMAGFRLNALRDSASASAIFLQNGNVPDEYLSQQKSVFKRIQRVITEFFQQDEEPYERFILKQPELAETLRTIAGQGKKGFYQGEIGKKLVDGVRRAGGIWTLEDLKKYQVVERKPVYGYYHGTKITSAAPPSSGGVALITMLNILSGYDLNSLEPAQQKHLIIEAMRRAYRDRALYLGDPDFFDVPLEQLMSQPYAAGLRASIHSEKATPSLMLSGGLDESSGFHTTHFSVLDKEGNRVSATLSINYPFGAAFVVPGTGVLLNDEMDDFSAKPDVPNAYGLVGGEANAIAAGKRPLSSMTPTFLENKDGIAILGTPGGSRIITMVLLAALDFMEGNHPESWVKLKRYHHQYLPDEVQYEVDALDQNSLESLKSAGHHFKPRDRTYGNMQAILWDLKSNQVKAASDPRGEGLAEVR
ncbi:MAG: gamma-glutamyltransferase family protein [Gammaproteobacteria bacterium]|nr:gamma-glutamyltransferase family protein [Gammaproteobacteria bacterium]